MGDHTTENWKPKVLFRAFWSHTQTYTHTKIFNEWYHSHLLQYSSRIHRLHFWLAEKAKSWRWTGNTREWGAFPNTGGSAHTPLGVRGRRRIFPWCEARRAEGGISETARDGDSGEKRWTQRRGAMETAERSDGHSGEEWEERWLSPAPREPQHPRRFPRHFQSVKKKRKCPENA